jgi:DNA polymerase-3 subunit alpha
LDIDIDTEQRYRADILALLQDYFGYDNVLNCMTKGKIKTKNCILTACRGLGIDNNISKELTSLIPHIKGGDYSLEDVFFGNEEKGFKKVDEFIERIKQYDGLKETMFLINNLTDKRSVHASAIYIFQNGFLKQNSLMKSSSGIPITAYTMSDSDEMGGLKMDFLTIEALDKLHNALDMLVEEGLIPKEKTVKELYEKNIYPNIIDYNNPNIWELLNQKKIMDAFQMDSLAGINTIENVQPSNLRELALANSLMRLQGEVSPMEKYCKHKKNPQLWYNEMREYGLNEKEIKLFEKHLKVSFGISAEQEQVMLLSMDKEICGFSIGEANALRKAIAKKKDDLVKPIKEKVFLKAQELNNRKEVANYFWETQVVPQLGYAFSVNHTVPYSVICIQEMNIAYKYMLFWNTACLNINSSSVANEDELEEELGENMIDISAIVEDYEEETEEQTIIKKQAKTVDYDKISKALALVGKSNVLPPLINKAKYSFYPDTKENKILYSLNAISNIDENFLDFIFSSRPFKNFNDFYEKFMALVNSKEIKLKKKAIINLIKAGCFDEFGEKREDLIKKFILNFTPNYSFDVNKIPELMENFSEIFDTTDKETYEKYSVCKRYSTYVLKNNKVLLQTGKGDPTKWLEIIEDDEIEFFENNFKDNFEEEKHYITIEDGYSVKYGSLKTYCDKTIEDLINKIKNSNLDEMKEKMKEKSYKEIFNKLCGHNIDYSRWEFDSLVTYLNSHELEKVNINTYNVEDFNIINDNEIHRIAGTVLGINKNKHLIYLLTTDYSVVNVKFYNKNVFNHYNSSLDSNNNKVESWFKRGNILMITGRRNNDLFSACKPFKSNHLSHFIVKISKINNNGEIQIETEK